MLIRTYSELSRLETFEERFEYLKLGAIVGEKTFGDERHLNQRFYTGPEWRNIRHHVIARDLGCDLGIAGREFLLPPIVHHMNPIRPHDIIHSNSDILNPEYLISVTLDTHNAIHFGNANRLAKPEVERSPGDTKLW